jgi:hypothetical protein
VSIDVELRVDTGVRLAAARRGPWLPLGPAVRRVAGEEPGHEPARAWFGELSGGGRCTPATDMAGRARGRDGFVDVDVQQRHLTSLHRCDIEVATPPVLPASLPWESPGRRGDGGGSDGRAWRLIREVAARLRGVDSTATPVPSWAGVELASRGELQERADGWWRRLCDNDPETVRHRLEQAFDTHGFGAAVAGMHGEVAGLVLGVAPVDLLVGRWQRGPGDRRLTRLPRPEQHRLHARMIRSALVALAAEALAVAPGLVEVRCGALQADHPERRPAVLALAELSRDVLTDVGRERLAEGSQPEPSDGGSAIHLAPLGSAGALAPLDRDLPVVRRLLDAVEG